MDIEKVRKEVRNAEGEILAILIDLEDKTDVDIIGIDLESLDYISEEKSLYRIVIETRI